MSFMKQQTIFGDWWQLDTDEGICCFPAALFDLDDVRREYPDIQTDQIELCEDKWGARLSAPGYMDCTEWTIHDTEPEALAYLEEMYGEEDAG